MHVHQQIFNLLRRERLAEARHFFAARADDFSDALIVCREPRQRKEFLFEHAFQPGALLATRRIGLVAASALVVVDAASGGLLRVQSQFGIGFAAFVAGGRGQQQSQCQPESKFLSQGKASQSIPS